MVARWNKQRGFGFIRTLEECTRRSSYDAEIFCHVSDIEDGNSLEPGSTVTFVSFFDRERGKTRAVQVRGGVRLPGSNGRGVR